jgi:hypothetical protein
MRKIPFTGSKGSYMHVYSTTLIIGFARLFHKKNCGTSNFFQEGKELTFSCLAISKKHYTFETFPFL